MNSCKQCGRILDQYNRKYPPKSSGGYIIPILAVDSLTIRKDKNNYQILLIKRGKEPSIGKYAFPGGHVNYAEKTEDACLRELSEEANLIGINPKLFNVYGEPSRDPRKHVISVVYEVEVNDYSSIKAGDDAAEAEFVNIKDVVNSPEMFAFDHYKILNDFISSKNELKNLI